MKNKVEMILEVPKCESESIIAALKKETASGNRFKSRIFMRGQKLIIEIGAEDLVALRAAVNSYLRYLQAIESVGNFEKLPFFERRLPERRRQEFENE